MKSCTKCGVERPLDEFAKGRGFKDGLQYKCKSCCREYHRQYYQKNKAKIDAKNRRWAVAHPEKCRENVRKYEAKPSSKVKALAYREANREQRAEYNKRWDAANPDKLAAKQKTYRARHPERVRAGQKRYRAENPEFLAELKKKWNAANPEALLRHRKTRYSKPRNRLDAAIRGRVWKTIRRGGKNGKRTFEALGYNRDLLMAHLEAGFTEGMTWENYGGWHVDHIIPLSAFNYDTVDHIDFKRAWALDNLRPLWGDENMRKGSKLEAPFQPSLRLAG